MPVSAPSRARVSFSGFELDLASRELHAGGRTVALPPKVFEILRTLVERPGEVVTRDELRTRLWSANTFVEFDDSLNHTINRLRQILGDSSDDPQFIETLPRYGYRFIPAVETMPELGRRHVFPSPAIVGVALLAVAAVLLAFYFSRWRNRLSNHAVEAPIQSLAVLPLSNLSGDPRQDYFADGMTDALITALAKVRTVKVISRTSVMRFKDVKKPLPEVAQALGVNGILEGSVQRSGDRVRITVQLVRAPGDTHLWAESYERNTRDLLTLQGEIAQAVAREIRATLTPEESTHLSRSRPVNPEAYEAYLKGQSHWYRLSREHLDTALEYFELARDKDPTCALAYVGINNVWAMRRDGGFMPPRQTLPKSKAAIAKALQLDDTLAEAHIALANTLVYDDHDGVLAEQEFRRGIELNPNSADGHFMYSDFLISMKRTEEWNAEIHRTLELDPFNPFFQCFYGWQLVYLGRYDEAITKLQKVLATEPDFSSAHMGLWGAYYKKGMYAEALAEARKFFAVLGYHEVEEALRRGYAVGGYTRAMHMGAEALAARSRRTYVPAVRVARLYAHAGNNEEVLHWLQKAYDQRETPLMHLGVAWDWDLLRTDPRFQDLLRRMNIP
ncbi:MAG TPA: winged helix-turn-helix domain-containing protein [Terriglobales bacterium]|nr:winged helix-turn-helix domain-containing protein [Terriglobales bacterium]